MKVNLETNLGNITIELDKKKAPKTVNNFVKYIQEGHYDKTIFHRVINGFMIQVLYILFWTWLLNMLCKNRLNKLSWFVVLFPLIMYILGILGLVSNGLLSVKKDV